MVSRLDSAARSWRVESWRESLPNARGSCIRSSQLPLFDGRAVGGTIPPPLKPWSRPVGARHGTRFRLANCRDFHEPTCALAHFLGPFRCALALEYLLP